MTLRFPRVYLSPKKYNRPARLFWNSNVFSYDRSRLQWLVLLVCFSIDLRPNERRNIIAYKATRLRIKGNKTAYSLLIEISNSIFFVTDNLPLCCILVKLDWITEQVLHLQLFDLLFFSPIAVALFILLIPASLLQTTPLSISAMSHETL